MHCLVFSFTKNWKVKLCAKNDRNQFIIGATGREQILNYNSKDKIQVSWRTSWNREHNSVIPAPLSNHLLGSFFNVFPALGPVGKTAKSESLLVRQGAIFYQFIQEIPTHSRSQEALIQLGWSLLCFELLCQGSAVNSIILNHS